MGVRKRPAAAMEELENRLKAEAEAELKQADEKRRGDREEHRRLICAEFEMEAVELKKRPKEEEDGEEAVREGGTEVDAEESGREPDDVVVEESEEADPSIEGEWMSPVVGQEAEAEPNPSSGSGWHPEVEEEDLQMPAGSSRNRISCVVEEEAEEELNPWGGMTTDEEQELNPYMT